MVDGDKSLVVQDKTLTACAKRNMKDIRPLAYELRKAKGGLITSENLYQGMSRAFTGGNIGVISNSITKVWNSGNITEEQINVVKWLCLYNNAVIDYAKTLWLPTPPENINTLIKSYTKANVPHFFVYAKDKEVGKVEPANNSTMNRISAVIPNPRVKYSKSIKKFDHTMLMKNEAPFTIQRNPILDAYDYWLTHRWKMLPDDEYVDNEEQYMYQKIRAELLSLHEDKDYIVNTLINYVYTIKKSSNKKLLWACFGKEIVENLKVNTVNLGSICPVCGTRFDPQVHNQMYCSEECYVKAHLQKKIANKEQK